MLSTYYTTLLLGPCYIVKVIAALIAANSQKKEINVNTFVNAKEIVSPIYFVWMDLNMIKKGQISSVIFSGIPSSTLAEIFS